MIIFLAAYFILIDDIRKAGLRGSDQYWYVADTETLLKGGGVYTNCHYPVRVLRGEEANPFIHNVPQVYLAAIPGLVFGAFNGWIVMNVLLNFGIAFLVYLMLKRKVQLYISASAAIFYLLCPISFWLSSQPLAEPFLAFIFTFIIYVYLNPDKFGYGNVRYLLLIFLSVLLSLSRYNFLPVLIMVAFVYFIENRREKNILFKSISILLGSLIILMIFKSFMPDNSSFISAVEELLIKKDSFGMVGFSGIESDTLPLKGIIENIYGRIIDALKTQFFSFDRLSILFYVPFNLMIILILLLHRFSDNSEDKIPVIMTLFVLILHLLTAIAFQNQFRYLLPYYPAIIVLFFIQLNSFLKQHFAKLISAPLFIAILCSVLNIIINTHIAINAIDDANTHRIFRDNTQRIFNSIIPVSDNVMIASNSVVTHYILRPRKVVIVNESYTHEQLMLMLKSLDIRWLICEQLSSIPRSMGDLSFKEFGMYEDNLVANKKTILIIYKID
jgi:4-amino-4-deoxy-L-arabinose transferase-like glycosyltransferase